MSRIAVNSPELPTGWLETYLVKNKYEYLRYCYLNQKTGKIKHHHVPTKYKDEAIKIWRGKQGHHAMLSLLNK